MKLITYFTFLSLMVINLYGQETENTNQKSLDDVIVKETFQVGSEEEKLPVTLDADFSNLVEIEERIQWSSVPWNFEGEKPGFEAFSGRLSSPELTSIAPQPVKVFVVNFEDLANWKIDIFTSDGQKFRTLSGEGDPPKSIAWDGKGDDNNPLVPGESYAYSFTAVDRAGNKRTFPGSAFSVPAFYLKDEDRVWVGLSNSTVFSPNGFGLTREADNYASEMVNFIYYFANGGKLSISANHPLTDQFLALLAKKLGRDINIFQKYNDAEYQDECFVLKIE